MNKERLKKDILLERLGKIIVPVSKNYGDNEFSIKMFFDNRIWNEENLERQKEIIAKEKMKLRSIPSCCYGWRKSFLERLKRYNKKSFGFEDLEKIFDQSDDLALGNFEDISSRTGIIAKTNEWYYKAMGKKAFTIEGEVPTKFSNDKYFYLANAKNFYERAKKSNLKKFIVQRWGAGTNLMSAEAFLAGLEHLDRKKKIFLKTKYVFSDYSKKSVADAKREAMKNKRLKRYVDLGVLNFEAIDALNPPKKYKSKVFYIESSYLYDSLPQSILAKVNGKFYWILYRGYVDENAEIYLNNNKKILPIELVKALRIDDWKVIKNLELKSFDAINGEIKLELVEIEEILYGKEIKEMVKDLDNVRIPYIDVIMKSLEKAEECLVDEGYIQVFDISATARIKGKLKIWGSFNRYHGAVYTGVNFDLLASRINTNALRAANSTNRNVRVEYGADYVSRILGEELIPLCDIVGMMRGDSLQAKKCFGLDKLKGFKILKEINNKMMNKFGYGEEGRRGFKRRLNGLKWLNWNEKIFKAKIGSNYLDDLFVSLMEYASGRIDNIRSRNLWLSDDKEKNKEFRKLLDKIGYKADMVVDSIFESKKEIYPSTAYYCMTVSYSN